jgi:hypothetical protein
LAFIPSDDRDLWVSVGMAIKDGFGDEGFALWDAWSRQSGRYNERDARDVWRSLKAGGGITLGTLFHEAKARSWRDDGTYQKPTPEEIEARRREAAERTAKEKAEKGRNGSKSSNNSGSKPWERENRGHLRAPRRRRLVVARLRPRAPAAGPSRSMTPRVLCRSIRSGRLKVLPKRVQHHHEH